MSAENIAICSMCQMTFDSHEEVLRHTCIEIKKEKIEAEEMFSDEKGIKDEFDSSKNDSDYSPKMNKSKKMKAKIRKIKEGDSTGIFKDDVKDRKGNPKSDESVFRR